VVGQELPPEKASSTCPQCGTEMVITRITPILSGGAFEALSFSVQEVWFYQKAQGRAKLIIQVCFRAPSIVAA